MKTTENSKTIKSKLNLMIKKSTVNFEIASKHMILLKLIKKFNPRKMYDKEIRMKLVNTRNKKFQKQVNFAQNLVFLLDILNLKMRGIFQTMVNVKKDDFETKKIRYKLFVQIIFQFISHIKMSTKTQSRLLF